VIFVLFPSDLDRAGDVVWLHGCIPLTARLLGGHQTARSLHFLVTILLVLFLLVHVFMIFLAGFRARMNAMITGRATPTDEVNL
jgi:thiosulfate reductase cytochrome b subunit